MTVVQNGSTTLVQRRLDQQHAMPAHRVEQPKLPTWGAAGLSYGRAQRSAGTIARR
jgi:hypothetical protein